MRAAHRFHVSFPIQHCCLSADKAVPCSRKFKRVATPGPYITPNRQNENCRRLGARGKAKEPRFPLLSEVLLSLEGRSIQCVGDLNTNAPGSVTGEGCPRHWIVTERITTVRSGITNVGVAYASRNLGFFQ